MEKEIQRHAACLIVSQVMKPTMVMDVETSSSNPSRKFAAPDLSRMEDVVKAPGSLWDVVRALSPLPSVSPTENFNLCQRKNDYFCENFQ